MGPTVYRSGILVWSVSAGLLITVSHDLMAQTVVSIQGLLFRNERRNQIIRGSMRLLVAGLSRTVRGDLHGNAR